MMLKVDLQDVCELGQELLMQLRYAESETTLAEAEQAAWEAGDFDTLARVYMPLQEARRQRRQRCGEGIVRMDLLAESPDDLIDGQQVTERYPHGQLLVAGWGSIEPALKVRKIQAERGLYVETLLGAVYPAGDSRVVVIVPSNEAALPPAGLGSVNELVGQLPAHSIVLSVGQLPAGDRRGNAETFSEVMDLWERLHRPFLAMADSTPDRLRQIEAYRRTIGIDYACELAHQRVADVARELAQA